MNKGPWAFAFFCRGFRLKFTAVSFIHTEVLFQPQRVNAMLVIKKGTKRRFKFMLKSLCGLIIAETMVLDKRQKKAMKGQ